MSDGQILLAFKAGRLHRREGTNFVDPSPAKGAIILSNGEDGLLHFQWKDRTTNRVEEDLILFPTDASFVKVSQAGEGRVYVLKFSSSNQRHFFWMQDASPTRDEEFANNVNGLLQDPDYSLVWGSSAASSSAAPAGASGSTSSQVPQATPEQLAQLQALVAQMAGQPTPTQPTVALTDILTPANVTPLFTSHPELIPALFPHLPPDLPVPPSADAIQSIISSPQFRSSVASFDRALRTGMLGGFVRSLGLPEEAGTSVEAFLRAINEQARASGDESMETD